jgi:hypothetical protein
MPRPLASVLPGKDQKPIWFKTEVSLTEIVVRYIQARDSGDAETQEKEFDRMREQVKDML